MDPKETIIFREDAAAEKGNPQKDVKGLWDRWDKAQKEEAPSELVKGYNLLGVVLIIAGSLFQTLSSGFLKFPVAPLIIIIGAGILAVKKFKSLWLQRSLNS